MSGYYLIGILVIIDIPRMLNHLLRKDETLVKEKSLFTTKFNSCETLLLVLNSRVKEFTKRRKGNVMVYGDPIYVMTQTNSKSIITLPSLQFPEKLQDLVVKLDIQTLLPSDSD